MVLIKLTYTNYFLKKKKKKKPILLTIQAQQLIARDNNINGNTSQCVTYNNFI